MRRPRVLHVSAVDFTTSKLLVPQLDHLVAAGYDVRVATGRTDPTHWEALAPFDPIDVPFPRALTPTRMLSATLKLRREAVSWRPDLIHLHTPAASLPVRLLPRALWPAGVKLVYTVHGYLHMWPPATPRDRFIQRIEQWQSRRTDLTLFQSQEDLDHARARRYGGDLQLLGNGVQDDWFDISPRPSKPVGKLDVLFVGRVVREKGILDLIEALASVNGVRLTIAGDALPSDRDGVSAELDSLVARLGLGDRVHRLGMVSRHELLGAYCNVDALCLPSYREGVPRSVIEALAAGRPVLATDIRGSRELVTDGQNGFIALPGDPAGLAQGLSRLRDMSPEQFSAMANAAKESVDPQRREAYVFDRLVDAYERVGVSTVVESEGKAKQ